MAPVHAAPVVRSLARLPGGGGLHHMRRELVAAGAAAAAHGLSRRDLTVNDTQKVTLGVIGAYVVVIAILWNVPYVRWVLWPFKVGHSIPVL